MAGAVRRSGWFDDLQNLGISQKVLNRAHGRAGRDVDASSTFVFGGGSYTARYYLNHGFLSPHTPGLDGDSFACAYQHAMAGHYGGQYWTSNGWFYPPDHGIPNDAPPDCMPVEVGDRSSEVQTQRAGYGLENTPGPYFDYLQGNTTIFGLGFQNLRLWFEMYGPDAGLGVPTPPAGAQIEWEYDTPEYLGIDSAADEDVTVTQTCVAGSPVAWKTPGGYSLDFIDPDDDGGHWVVHTGTLSSGILLGYQTGAPDVTWLDITSLVDWPYLAYGADPDGRDWDLIATASSAVEAPPECPKPGALDMYRDGEWLALRLRMRARRYRWVYTEEFVVRQYPRDSLGLASAPRQYPPPRTGRLVGGHQ